MFKVPEQYRVKKGLGQFDSDETFGNNGVFFITIEGRKFKCIASDGLGWEHVSVSLPHRTPNWREMCIIKDLFWSEDDVVFQIHPAKKNYINNHPHCLHLWRPIDQTMTYKMLPFMGMV